MASKTQTTDSSGTAPNSSLNPDVRTRRPPKIPQKPKQSAPRPTHFLSLPLGHHSGLRDKVREFHQKLLPSAASTTVIEGLDRSILVDPRRLHLTIGVMVLSLQEVPQPTTSGTPQARTLSEAITLLQSLGPELDAITREPVQLSLDKMGVLKTQREQAGVLYVAPSDEINENTIKTARIFDLVGQRFRQEGFIQEAVRPAVLHCTLINASHRKPRRIPRTFSYREIFDLASADASSSVGTSLTTARSAWDGSQRAVPQDKSVRVDFGTWAVSEVQLCKMGSHGPENEYISVASVPIGGN